MRSFLKPFAIAASLVTASPSAILADFKPSNYQDLVTPELYQQLVDNDQKLATMRDNEFRNMMDGKPSACADVVIPPETWLLAISENPVDRWRFFNHVGEILDLNGAAFDPNNAYHRHVFNYRVISGEESSLRGRVSEEQLNKLVEFRLTELIHNPLRAEEEFWPREFGSLTYGDIVGVAYGFKGGQDLQDYLTEKLEPRAELELQMTRDFLDVCNAGPAEHAAAAARAYEYYTGHPAIPVGP